MMVHVLSGQWPFPGEAVRVNPRNPNNPNDLVGVTEFDHREEYISLIGNEHPLMTLIQQCLSNSPSHRPTSSEVHQRASAVAADHPPSFTNRVEMMERIKALSEEKERMRSDKDNTIAEKDAVIMERDRSIIELKDSQSNIDRLCQSHSIEVEALQTANVDLKADNEHLQATVTANKKMYVSEQEAIIKRYEKRLETMKIDKRTTVEWHQSDKQALEQKYAFQLRALEDEHRVVKEAMEQQHQVQLEAKTSELLAKGALISSKSSIIQSLQVKLGQALGTSSSKDHLSVFSPGVKLTFTECAKTPVAICGIDQGIVIGKHVYAGVGYDRKFVKYSINDDAWSFLPRTPVKYTRIGYLYKKILLVGGHLSSNQVTADIYEFDEASQPWVKSTSIPPMPTARQEVTAVSWSSPPALIVCGGSDTQNNPMTAVEVYHSRTSQWHTASPLPFPRDHMTNTVIHNILYLMGGFGGSESSTYKKTVMSTSIPQLLETCLQPSSTQWQSLPIPNVPHYKSTAASLGGCLLVVGGIKDLTIPPKPNSIVSSVHAYCPFTSSWVLVGELPQPLYRCITTTLPTRELLVMGGRSSSDNKNIWVTDNTYKCSISM